MKFEAPLAPDMQKCLELLRLHRPLKKPQKTRS
jgi:hypothetical protein